MSLEIIHTQEVNGWSLRQRTPAGNGPHPMIVMLHGWTGDENAMWIFASRLPEGSLLLSLRGLFTTPLGGYGWHPHKGTIWPWIGDFKPTMEALLGLLTPSNFANVDWSRMSLVGFSQGAALAFTFALSYPGKVFSMAGLSGFLPDGAESLTSGEPLEGMHVFMAHGTFDELVPVQRARAAVKMLGQAGAQVAYCEDDVGHKLSASCFRGMQVFFKRS